MPPAILVLCYFIPLLLLFIANCQLANITAGALSGWPSIGLIVVAATAGASIVIYRGTRSVS